MSNPDQVNSRAPCPFPVEVRVENARGDAFIKILEVVVFLHREQAAQVALGDVEFAQQ